MFNRGPLWPAQLDHIRIDSEQPAPLISFYRDAMGMTPVELDDGTVLMQAPARRILIGRGVSGAQPFMAFKLQTEPQLDALRRHISNRGLKALPSPTANNGTPFRRASSAASASGAPSVFTPSVSKMTAAGVEPRMSSST